MLLAWVWAACVWTSIFPLAVLNNAWIMCLKLSLELQSSGTLEKSYVSLSKHTFRKDMYMYMYLNFPICSSCHSNNNASFFYIKKKRDFSYVFWIDFTSWWNWKNHLQIKLQQRDILFTFQPRKLSFLGINYCFLVTRNYIYISAKKEDLLCFTFYLKFLKKTRSWQTKRFRTLLLFRALLFDSCQCL